MVKMSREKFRSLCNRLGLECKHIDYKKYLIKEKLKNIKKDFV